MVVVMVRVVGAGTAVRDVPADDASDADEEDGEKVEEEGL